jgi:putative transposase
MLNLIFSRLLSRLMLLARASSSQAIEWLVLRREVALLRRTNPRPRLNWADQGVFAALIRRPPTSLRAYRLITPATVARWHHRLLTNKWTYPHRAARPPLDLTIAALIEQMASENRWRASQIKESGPNKVWPGQGG